MESAGRKRVLDTSRTVRLSVTVPKEHHAELLRIAKKNRVSVAWVVREAVARYVENDAPLFYQVR
jgi:predicted transcriptional regulator